jgi:hypothetical protein
MVNKSKRSSGQQHVKSPFLALVLIPWTEGGSFWVATPSRPGGGRAYQQAATAINSSGEEKRQQITTTKHNQLLPLCTTVFLTYSVRCASEWPFLDSSETASARGNFKGGLQDTVGVICGMSVSKPSL